MSNIPSSVLRQVEARETQSERWLAGFRIGVGFCLFAFHSMIFLWRFRGMEIRPTLFLVDLGLVLYGAGLLVYLRRAAYHPARKYILLTVDLAGVMIGMLMMRLSMKTPIVTYIVAMPQALLVSMAGLRFSPRLVLYTGALALLGFVAFVLSFEGFVPLVPGGALLLVGFTLASYLACRGLLNLTIEALRQSRLTRFFSPEVAREIIDREDSAELGGSASVATVLFADIRGFTSLSERMLPAHVVLMLNEYFGEMVEAVFAHKGMLDKFIGDAIMAVFGAPVPSSSHAADALAAAREMQTRLESLNTRRTERGDPPLQIGIGIHTGPVLLGRIGHERRMEYTAIGDTVNVASRLEGLTKEYGTLLLSQETVDLLPEGVLLSERAEVQVKGRSRPVRVFAAGSQEHAPGTCV